MPHAVVTRKLGRSRSHRKATVRSLAQALLRYERITTTLAKAKEAQRLAERLITLGKSGTLSARRQAIRLLADPPLVGKLFSEIAPRFQNRRGGYTRIMHNGFRSGDGASLAFLELTELIERTKRPKKEKEEDKPKAAPPREERPLRPVTVETLPAQPPAKTPERPRKEKPVPKEKGKEKEEPKGFLQGLRKFFKGRTKK